MEQGIERYIANIHNRATNLLDIINQHQGGSLVEFISNQNLHEFLKEMLALHPYINSKQFDSMPGFKGLANQYLQNIDSLKQKMKSAYFFNFNFLEKDYSLLEMGLSATALISPLTDIKNNTANQLYQIKINS